MSEKRRLYTDVYGLVSTDGRGFQVVANLTRQTVVVVDAGERRVTVPDGREFRLDKGRFQQVLRSSVPVE